MAKQKVVIDNKVILALLNAMAELDTQRAKESPDDPTRVQEYRQMHGKIEAIIKYIQARIEIKEQ